MSVVQIRFGTTTADWHRLMLDRHPDDVRRTACDKRVPDTYRATREPNYEEPLCRDGCFSPAELTFAAKLAETKRAKARAEAEAFEERSDARAIEREDSRRVARERVEHATGEQKPVDPEPEA